MKLINFFRWIIWFMLDSFYNYFMAFASFFRGIMVFSTLFFALFYKSQHFALMAVFIGTIIALSLFLEFFDTFLYLLKPKSS